MRRAPGVARRHALRHLRGPRRATATCSSRCSRRSSRSGPSAEWLEQLYAAAIPCGPINTVAEGFAEPHTAARGLVVETEHPRYGTVRSRASPVSVGPRRTDHRRAPQRNEDFDYVVRELLGLRRRRIGSLVAAAAFGDPERTPHLPAAGQTD